jgi:hypothetical protein
VINLTYPILDEEFSIKKFSFFLILFLASGTLFAQTIGFTIDPTLNNSPISPFSYGSNDVITNNPTTVTTPTVVLVHNVPLYRQGGNRLTAYNWENNASNGGSDYCSMGGSPCNHEDNYMFPPGTTYANDQPATTLTAFILGNNAVTASSLVTLQMAGYVSANPECNCFVTITGAADTSGTYWKAVSFTGSSLTGTTAPVTTDNVVYMNEEMSYLLASVNGAGAGGAKFYDLDNEPALWNSTHPLVHPNQPTCGEVSSKGISLSTVITGADANAQILGPVAFGWSEYVNNDGASDDSLLTPYNNGNVIAYLNYYLAQMNSASSTAGRRLLHYLDLHWYPEATGLDGSTAVRITNDDTTQGVAIARMQAPRSLWDPTYTETSWITADSTGGPITLIPRLQAAVSQYYPGTGLSFSEYQYGSGEDISGGVAQADALGIFGQYGILACRWDDGTNNAYVAAAFNFYLNYDGKGSQFGNTAISALSSGTNAVSLTSVYAALDSTHPNRINAIILNKDYTSNHGAAVTLNNLGLNHISSITSYRFDSTTSTAYNPTAPSFTANTFSDTLPFRSATLYQISLSSATPTPTLSPTPCTDEAGHTCTFTPTPTDTGTPYNGPPIGGLLIYPNPLKGPGPINLQFLTSGTGGKITFKLLTVAFRKVRETSLDNVQPGLVQTQLDMVDDHGTPLANGLYYLVINAPQGRLVGKIINLR